MSATLPEEVRAVFDRFVTAEYTTIDARGQPITWPVNPYYRPGDECIDVTTGLGYPKKARDAEANPKVALLFSEPKGSRLERPPTVLVQGTATVDDRGLDANADRYMRDALEKLPATRRAHPPKPLRRFFSWYYARIYVHVRPERVYVWPDGDPRAEPQLFDSHIEEVRSGHDEEPDVELTPPEGGSPAWDERIEELGSRHATAVLSIVAPDGFPFSMRLPVSVDPPARRIRIEGDVVGMPLQPGLACLTAHEHDDPFTSQRNFQVRGDLVVEDGGWALIPHRLVGGFELPPGSLVGRMRLNYTKVRRFRRTAKRELARRGG